MGNVRISVSELPHLGAEYSDATASYRVYVAVLDSRSRTLRAGAKAGALQVRFNGLNTRILPQRPDFMKSLDVDHSHDGEVMIAYAMNGMPLPLLNGRCG